MSPEANVKEKPLTVTAPPPPAALAAEKKKAEKKRSEAENLIDGHAATIKGNKLTADQQAALLRKQGRTGAAVGFALLGLGAFLVLQRYGGLYARPAGLHEGSLVYRMWMAEGVTAKASVTEAYQNLVNHPFFFGLTTKMWQFRIFFTLSAFFLAALAVFPALFGKYWMKLGQFLGSIMTPILLGVMFFVGFAPAAILMKILGRDPLGLSKHDGTYWISRQRQRPNNHFEHLS